VVGKIQNADGGLGWRGKLPGLDGYELDASEKRAQLEVGDFDSRFRNQIDGLEIHLVKTRFGSFVQENCPMRFGAQFDEGAKSGPLAETAHVDRVAALNARLERQRRRTLPASRHEHLALARAAIAFHQS